MIPILIAVAVLAGVGVILGILIGIAGHFLHVEEDPRLEVVTSKLPGANCGGCGYPGCSGLAEAIVFEGADPKNCKPGKPEMVEDIKAYLKQWDLDHPQEEK